MREESSQPESVPAMIAVPGKRRHPLFGSKPGLVGLGFLVVMFAMCLGTLPWTLAPATENGVARYDSGDPKSGRLPPSWWVYDEQDIERSIAAVDAGNVREIGSKYAMDEEAVREARIGPAAQDLAQHWPRFFLGSDMLGRSLGVRLLAGGGISLGIGIAAACISVGIGTIYGAFSAYMGGAVDAIMMRIVDVLYGLPYILLVVLLAVASSAQIDEYISRSKAKSSYVIRQTIQIHESETGSTLSKGEAESYLEAHDDLRDRLILEAIQKYPAREVSTTVRGFLDVGTLLLAIGGVSWLTMARVIRGQVLSLKNQQFVEAARAVGAPGRRVFVRHLLPNLIGPIVVYATLAVPQAILQESFLSFLGIGVKPPLPSWGNLAAEGLSELNTYRSHWWLLFFPCLLLGMTLLAMNFVGEGLREAFDPKRSR